LCSKCKQPGHNKNNVTCPQYVAPPAVVSGGTLPPAEVDAEASTPDEPDETPVGMVNLELKSSPGALLQACVAYQSKKGAEHLAFKYVQLNPC